MTSNTNPPEGFNGGHIPETDGQFSHADEYIELGVLQVNYTTKTLHNNEKRPIIHLFGRQPETQGTDTKKSIKVNIYHFDPYFYIPEHQKQDLDPADNRILDTEGGFESIRGDSLTRVTTDIPRSVSQLREDYDHYEADVLFPDRFLVDNGITSGIRIPARWDDEEKTSISVFASEVESAEVAAKPRIHTFDIEVDDRNGFPEAEKAPEKILCLTSHDSYNDQYTIWFLNPGEDTKAPLELPQYEFIRDKKEPPVEIRTFDTENDLLLNYIEYINQTNPDLVAGWNAGEFDARYLVNRLEKKNKNADSHNLSPERLSRIGEIWKGGWRGPNIKGRVVFDLLEAYKRTQFTELDSYRLDAIGETELGVGKEHFDGDISDLWEDDPSKLIEYNLRDVEICVELDNKQEIIEFWDEVRQFVGCRIQDAPIPGDAIDMYVLHEVNDEFVLPTKGTVEGGEKFEGGAVFDPITGIEENVTVLDLKSLYPMCMTTINASPETKVGDDFSGETYTAPNGIQYRKDKDGIIREMVNELLNEREKKKELRNNHDPDSEEYIIYDRQQAAIKVIMNALYGVSGWQQFRLYDKDNAAAVTATGREVIRFTETVVNEMGYEVTYGDTDSVMLKLDDNFNKEEAIEESFEIEDVVNSRYQDFAEEQLNASDHNFQIEFEKLYKRFLQAGKKKRYAGHIIWKEGKDVNNIDIVGFEYKRSDIAGITKTAQEQLIRKLVQGADLDEIEGFLHDLINDFQTGGISIEQVGIPSGIGKPIDEYETDTAHIRGAKYANLLMGTNFGENSKPKRVYINRVDPSFFQKMEKEKGLRPRTNELYAEFKQNPDVICFIRDEQIPEDLEIDWDKMLDKTLKGPISRILDAVDLSWSTIKTGQEQTGLENFM